TRWLRGSGRALATWSLLRSLKWEMRRIAADGDAKRSSCVCSKAFQRAYACAQACGIRKRPSPVRPGARQTSHKQAKIISTWARERQQDLMALPPAGLERASLDPESLLQ